MIERNRKTQPTRSIGSRRTARSRNLKTLRSRSRFSRRKFLGQTAGTGLLLRLAPNLGKAQSEGVNAPRTLFFNLAREQSLAGEESYARQRHFFNIGGQSYTLKQVTQRPGVLAQARGHNAFLRAVPDDQITHYIDNFAVTSDITPLGYLGSTIDEAAGTWSMSSVVQYLSPSAVSKAYGHARHLKPEGPLPLSAKREFYGIEAAFTAHDLADELALIDYTDAARTLIALQPDMLCANPAGAEEIAVSYISANSGTRFLAGILERQGPAKPQESPGQLNSNGWATLIPLNQDDGTPFKMTDGLNQYFPDWNDQVDRQVGSSVRALSQQVKNDPDLGADITSLVSNDGTFATLDETLLQELTGKVWYRHDGVTAVDHGSDPSGNSLAPKWVFAQQNGETGLAVTQPQVEFLPGDRVRITLNNVSNWFLRYLGIYLQFIDRDGRVIPRSDLPPDTVPNHSDVLDRGNAVFLGIVPPVFSIAGVPVYPPGSFSGVVNVPPAAATINGFYAGMGGSGSLRGPEKITDVGIGMTSAINYGLVGIFMAAGVSTFSAVTKQLIGTLGQAIAFEIISLIGASLNSPVPSINQAIGIMRGLLQAQVGKGLATFFTWILTHMAAAQFINSVPVAGQIARAAAATIGAVQLAVTSIEVAISPPVYQFDLSFTHDLSLNIEPDPNRGVFPQLPAGYVLYYKINYLFDNGSPHYLDHVDVLDPNVRSIPIRLNGIPWGGQVNISVGFYSRKESTDPSENDWCAGKGTTGLVSNTVDQAPNIVLQDVLVPIQKQTVYIHTSKITLDAGGRHRWTKTATPPSYVPPSSGQRPGDIGGFRSITVRQSTSKYPGYVGYSWQAYSSGLLDCQTGARGQLDQAANLNTNMGNDGANAQNGYATIPCGLQGGASSGIKLSYNLLSASGANFYLDTSSLMLREVQLDPVPEFGDPVSGRSFGKLNLASTVLLLHPAGHVVSINNANSKFEALHLPADATDDATASKRFLARTYSGQGSRPGLMRSPMAACINAEGAILVLEDSTANNRIQAFDLGGNPVPFFKNQKSPYFLPLPATAGATYLDLAVEFTGYLYVLSRSGSPPVFRLDIYHPAQSDIQPISTTKGLNAAKLTVDFWRNVYTLNYEVLKLPSGQIPTRTEPSLSFWVPPPPTV
jgi:hypothetical protein